MPSKMHKAIRHKLWQAIEAASNDQAPVADKACAARNLAAALSETMDAVGAKKAARLYRAMMEKAAALNPPTHEATPEELTEVWLEMQRQKQQLN